MKRAMTIWLWMSFVLLGVQGTGAQEDADAYLWLEEVEGERALSWVKEKNQATLAVLQAPPMYEELYQKTLEILDSDQRIAYPSFRGEYLHNFWQDAKNERGLWRRTTLEEYLKPSPNWEVLLDMKRYNHLLAGASWMAEYGNPDLPEEWAYISRYSPYHNLSTEKKYPQVFFCTSTRDDRVHPGHARKMVAKMEDMGHTVYYYENTEGGHAAAATNRQRAMRTALSYAYLWTQLK